MRVVTIGSGVAGVGRSFAAANLAVALAHRGARTCLVDLDFQNAEQHLLLGQLRPQRSVLELLRGEALSMAELMISADLGGRLFLVPGAPETIRPASLRGSDVDRLVSELRQLPAEFVVVDLPASTAHQALDLFLAGDAQYLVSTTDPAALAAGGAYLRLARSRRATRRGAGTPLRSPRVYNTLDDLVRDMDAIRSDAGEAGPRFRPGLILNRCPLDDEASAAALRALRAAAGEGIEPPLEAEIPEDLAVDRAAMLLDPVVEYAPTSTASAAIGALAAALLPRTAVDAFGPLPSDLFEAVPA